MSNSPKGYTVESEVDGKDIQVDDLVDWKNPPTLRELKADYKASEAATDEQAKKVEDWLDAYKGTGKYAAPAVEGRSRMVIKLIRKQVEWRCPTLTEPFLSSPKLFEVQPRTFEDKASATQNELILNYQFKSKLNSVKLLDEVIRTMGTEGTAIIKSSWLYREDTYTDYETEYEATEIIDPAVIEQMNQMVAQIQQQPEMMDQLDEATVLSIQTFMESGELYQYMPVGEKEVERTKVINNHPNAELCNVEDVFVDPTCKGDINKAKFLVHKFQTCVAELREDGRYSNLDILETEVGNHEQTSSTVSIANNFKFKDIARKGIDAFEYWGYYDIDGTGTLHSFVATWVGETLIRMERNPYPDNRIPFTFIPLIPVRGSLYGEPDAELIKDNQQIISATVRGTVDTFARSANGQTGFAKNFLDQRNLDRFNQGKNYQFSANMDPRAAVHQHIFSETPNSVYQLINYMSNDAESFSGVKAFSQGINSDALGKTAKGARTALDATAIRDASILRRIAQGLTEVAYKFQTMNALFLTEDDVVRLTNSEFVQVDPQNLSGDFDLVIDISTAESDAQKANDLSFLLQTGQNTFPFEFTQEILAEIARLKKQPKLEQFIRNYQPQPDPMQEKLKELELAKLEAEIAQIRADTAEKVAKAQVNAAEVNVRNARADNTQSITDKNTVQTYKDANGISQAEKLELEQTKQDNKAKDDLRKHDLGIQAKKNDHNLNLLSQGANSELKQAEQAQMLQGKLNNGM